MPPKKLTATEKSQALVEYSLLVGINEPVSYANMVNKFHPHLDSEARRQKAMQYQYFLTKHLKPEPAPWSAGWLVCLTMSIYLFTNQWHLHHPLSTASDRGLSKLVGDASTWQEVAWGSSLMKERFPDRSANEIRQHAQATIPEMKLTRRCSFGLSTTRCSNHQSPDSGLTFMSVPNNPKVLSHMAIRSEQWAPNLICCSDHGHDPTRELAFSNLPTRPSSRSSRKRDLTPNTSPSKPPKKKSPLAVLSPEKKK